MKIFSSKALALCLGVFVFSTAISYIVMAWEEPDGAPPENNVAAPVNVGNTTQTKNGGLNILGMVGIGNSAPSQKLDVTGGNVKGDGLCIGSDCCTNWAECVALGGGGGGGGGDSCTPATCPGGTCINGVCVSSICKNFMEKCNANSDCCTGVCFEGSCSFYHPCNTTELPSGYKRIFVTNLTFTGSILTSLDIIDKKCKDAAQNAKLPGTYKALLSYYKQGDTKTGTVLRSPMDVFTSSSSVYTNLGSIGDQCAVLGIATGGADFFTKDDAENYLENPIKFDENGFKAGGINGVYVWTNFKPKDFGDYDVNANVNANYGCFMSLIGPMDCNKLNPNICRYWTYCDSSDCWMMEAAQHYYGKSSQRDLAWAYNLSKYADYVAYNTDVIGRCNSNSRALYCVEQ